MSQRVLLVEDDVWLRELYADAFTDVEIELAASAEEALAILDQMPIDLVVLDMFLPGHNGVEFLHEIASYEDTAQLPVIVLSAVAPHEMGLDQKRMRHYQIVAYLYKPEVKPIELARKVKQVLLEHETQVPLTKKEV